VAICAACRVAEPGDRFVYVESDLIWEPDTIMQLVDGISNHVHAVAPMSMAWLEARFYDIWGHQKNGRRFSAHPPYYEGWNRWAHDLTPIDTAGSCFVLDRRALGVAEFSAQDCIRGIGRTLLADGMQLFLDPTASVYHP
jgi:hypothetical protein